METFIHRIHLYGVKNCKTRLDADCGSDHNPVIARMNIKFQTSSNIKKSKETGQRNTDVLKEETVKRLFKEVAEEKFYNITDMNNVDILWSQIKSCITETAEQEQLDCS